MSDVVYVGRVRWVHENPEKNYRHATVQPLVHSSEDQKRWIGSIEDTIAEFPARGFVYWHDAPEGLEVEDQGLEARFIFLRIRHGKITVRPDGKNPTWGTRIIPYPG